MSDLMILQPTYRWFDFAPANDITVQELADILSKVMRMAVTEETLVANPHLFKHFKVHEDASDASDDHG